MDDLYEGWFMTHGSLFSGVGGFDIAAQWMGWDNLFHCEINPFGRQVLNYYWPDAISYEDITKTDFSIHRGRIDVLTGGFPCQPFSLAGKRKGTDDERHLWPAMLRAIREIEPRWIVGENVFGLVNWDGGLVFEQVQADLENEGYEVQPYILPACSVNAPHRRNRVWFVAYASSNRRAGLRQGFEDENRESKSGKSRFVARGPERFCSPRTSPNPKSERGKQFEPRQQPETSKSKQGELGGGNCTNTITYANGERLRGESDGVGKPRFLGETSKEYDWQNFPTQSPICGRNDGVPSGLVGITVSKHRNESIKAYGNAIVPQVVRQIFKAIQAYEHSTRHQRLD